MRKVCFERPYCSQEIGKMHKQLVMQSPTPNITTTWPRAGKDGLNSFEQTIWPFTLTSVPSMGNDLGASAPPLPHGCTCGMVVMHYSLELRRKEGPAFTLNICGICAHATEVTMQALGWYADMDMFLGGSRDWTLNWNAYRMKDV